MSNHVYILVQVASTSIHNLIVIMIYSVQKLSLHVFHKCEYIILLQVGSAT